MTPRHAHQPQWPIVVAVIFTVVGVLAALLFAVALKADWLTPQSQPLSAPAPSSSSRTLAPAPPSAVESTQPEEEQEVGTGVQEILQQAVDAAESQVGGVAAIAVSDGENATVAGDDSAYPAWSTIKVPLAIAALKQDPNMYSHAQAAITASDNAAAQTLNSILAPGAADSVLAEAGVGVSVNTAVVRPEFSTFGQTLWSASQEATFAANLGCVQGSAPVLELMGNISPSQAYGLGQLPGARFKGGWGPDTSGMYQVRQLGLVANSSGSVAVGITALPSAGTYEAGQAMINAMVSVLSPHLDALPTSRCS